MLGIHQLRGDPHAVAFLAHIAFDQVADAEALADLADVLAAVLEREGRGAGDDLQLRAIRQAIDELFGQAVAEVLVVRVVAAIDEGQYRDGEAAGRGPGRVAARKIPVEIDDGAGQQRRKQPQHHAEPHAAALSDTRWRRLERNLRLRLRLQVFDGGQQPVTDLGTVWM